LALTKNLKVKISSIVVGSVAMVFGAPAIATALAVSISDLAWIGAEALRKDPGSDLHRRIDDLLNEFGEDADVAVLELIFDDNREDLKIDFDAAIVEIRKDPHANLTSSITSALNNSLRLDGHNEAQQSKAHILIHSAVSQVLETDAMRYRFTEAALIDLIRASAQSSDTLRKLLNPAYSPKSS